MYIASKGEEEKSLSCVVVGGFVLSQARFYLVGGSYRGREVSSCEG
jgi:hypothetical protein